MLTDECPSGAAEGTVQIALGLEDLTDVVQIGGDIRVVLSVECAERAWRSVAGGLTSLVQSSQGSFVLSVEAPWGLGKTSFPPRPRFLPMFSTNQGRAAVWRCW